MLKLTKTGIGLLTRQYKSVLHKCFLMNIGIFSLSTAVATLTPTQTEAKRLANLTATDILGYLGTVSGSTATSANGVTWTNDTSAAPSNFDSTTLTTTGSTSVNIAGTEYILNYTYKTPYTTKGGSTKTENVYFGDASSVSNSALRLTSSSSISTIKADFLHAWYTNNGTANGGALQNYISLNSINGNFINGHTTSAANYDANGAAIWFGGSNNKDVISTIIGDFISNYVYGSSANGGAIYNTGTMSSISGDFIANRATFYKSSSAAYAKGGAIYNNKKMSIAGNFISNSVYTDQSYYNTDSYGGAIYNLGTIDLSGSFINNYAYAKANGTSSGTPYTAYAYGGAIYNTSSGTVNLNVNDKDILFYGNYYSYSSASDSAQIYNDITNYGTVNLNAANGKKIIFNGTIESPTNVGTLNLSTDSAYHGGNYIFANSVSGHTVKLGSNTNSSNYPALVQLRSVKQPDGTITQGNFADTTTLINYNSGSILDTQNGYMDNTNIGTLTLHQNLGLKIDVDISEQEADTINASYDSVSEGILAIQDINFGEWKAGNYSIILTEKEDLKSAYTKADNLKISGSFADYVDKDSITVENGVLSFTTFALGGGSYTAGTGISISDDKVISISNGGVGATQLADDAVETTKINNGAVTTAKIANLNVITDKIAANAVTYAKLNADVYTSSVTSGETKLITSGGVKNFLDTNYSRKLTKTSTFCDGLDGKIRVANDNTTTAANDNTATAATARAVANTFKKAI